MTQNPDSTARCIGGQLTLAEVVAIAHGAPVMIDPGALAAVRERQLRADELAAQYPTYGRTTGVGANRTTEIDDEAGHGLRLLRSHAADAGTELPEPVIRAMLAVRANQLCLPGSGLAPEIVQALATMLNSNALPRVREFGSVGTGDLTALAATALTLLGERAATGPLTAMPEWDSGHALPFLSSSALTIGRTCLALAELIELDRAGRVVFALISAATGGNRAAFAAPVAAASAVPAVAEVCDQLRTLLPGTDAEPNRIQDPYALRIYPLAQATLLTAAGRLEALLTGLVQAAQENPLFTTDQVLHHGLFYQAQLAAEVAAVNLALSVAATNQHARLRYCNEPANTGLRPFLATGPAGSSGLMMLEYTAGSALAEIRSAALPASVQTLSLSRSAEEDSSFASQAVAQLERSVAASRVLLCCEILAAGQLSWLRPLPDGLLASAQAVVQEVAIGRTDTDPGPLLERAEELIPGLANLC